MPPRGRRIRYRELPPESLDTSTDVLRPETETEDDGDIDMDRTDDHSQMIDTDVASASAFPSPEQRTLNDTDSTWPDVRMNWQLYRRIFRLEGLALMRMHISLLTKVEVSAMAVLKSASVSRRDRISGTKRRLRPGCPSWRSWRFW